MKQVLAFGDSNTWGLIPGIMERYPEHIRWTGVLRKAAGSLGCRLAFLSAPKDAFALWLRLGLCELCLARDEGRACQGVTSLKLLAGGWRVLVREEDMLWFRWLGSALP